MTDLERATPLFNKGLKVSQVMTQLNVTRHTGDQLKRQWEAAGGVVQEKKQPITHDDTGGDDSQKDDTEEEPEDYELSLTVPIDRVDDIFAAFTIAEKMAAIASVLQERLDEILNAEAEDTDQ